MKTLNTNDNVSNVGTLETKSTRFAAQNSRFRRLFCIPTPKWGYPLLIGTLALSLGACRPLLMQSIAPSGPPEYRLGWEDGCDSGVSAEDSSGIYKWTLGFKKRPEMAGQEQYKSGWNEGFSYCRFSYASIKSDQNSFWR